MGSDDYFQLGVRDVRDAVVRTVPALPLFISPRQIEMLEEAKQAPWRAQCQGNKD